MAERKVEEKKVQREGLTGSEEKIERKVEDEFGERKETVEKKITEDQPVKNQQYGKQ